jgi:hypothetical protein
VGKGDGANYGGIAGADAYCAQMAQGGGIATPPGRTWRAYLSMPAQGGQPAVNARDRIGAGPWFNARGSSSPTTSPISTATCSAIATASTRQLR